VRPRKRVALGIGSSSRLKFRHIIPRKQPSEAKLHRIIVGSRRSNFRPTLNALMSKGGTGGNGGTADILIRPNGTAEIRREIPEHYQGLGIGTDLLSAAERIARKAGANFIEASTENPLAKRTYEKAGWKFIDKTVITVSGEKHTYYQYGKKLS